MQEELEWKSAGGYNKDTIRVRRGYRWKVEECGVAVGRVVGGGRVGENRVETGWKQGVDGGSRRRAEGAKRVPGGGYNGERRVVR